LISDVWTVMWKEWKELLFQRTSTHGGALTLLIVIGVFGIIFPMQQGNDWVASPLVLLLSGWVSFLSVANVVADSFAGERERHTLETLLASRLSDRAILLGKFCAAVSYGWGITLLVLLLGLFAVNLACGRGTLLLYQGAIGWGSVGIGLLSAGLAASAGVLISLRAPTVRQAQQTLSLTAMLLPVALYALAYGCQVLAIDRHALVAAITATSMTEIVCIVMAILTALDMGLLVLALARFKRSRLILD